MDFHFLVMEKSWKINVEKEGAPCRMLVKCYIIFACVRLLLMNGSKHISRTATLHCLS